MFIDARTLEAGTAIAADVCIVGGGASGLAVALELLDRPSAGARKIVVLESGGMEPRPATERLNAGRTRGPLVGRRSRYLRATRRRAFGGLGEVWAGSCRPFAAEDLERRSWVADSGWPLTAAELAPWVEKAAGLLGVEARPGGRPPALLPEGDPAFAASWLPFAPQPSVAALLRDRFTGAGTEVLTHATATRIRLDAAGRRAAGVVVRCLDGPRLEVVARRIVLAAGALENARLLLLSDDRRPRGLGNERDLVGRYFSEQIVMRAGFVALPGRGGWMAPWETPTLGGDRSYAARAVLHPTAALRRRHELLDSIVTFEPAGEEEAGELAGAVAGWAAAVAAERADGTSAPTARDHFGALELRGEQVPMRSNRLRLGDERDAFGLRRIDLRWRPSEHDLWSLRTTARLFAETLGRCGAGRAQLRAGRLSRRSFGWSGHQSGTARMSREPATGVVDPDCRVHDVDDLFVAGSAVFPTGGSAGPMLTSIALSLRLGRHLRDRAAAG